MNILLINDNPVVSRLLAMCTRSEGIILEEVVDVRSITCDRYDIVFIDDRVYKEDLLHLSNTIDIGKKILLAASNTPLYDDFDAMVQKPFLPSQIIEILDAYSKRLEEREAQVLDPVELERIKALLDMEDEIDTEDNILSEEALEQRKVEIIKAQLIADGLEIVGEEEIMEDLSKKKSKKKKVPNHKDKQGKKKKHVAFTQEELEQIEEAVQVAIATLKRKQMKKLLKGKKIEIAIKLQRND